MENVLDFLGRETGLILKLDDTVKRGGRSTASGETGSLGRV